MPAQKGTHKGTTKGFKRSDTLLAKQIRKASETRGFAQSRILTHWEEIAGPDAARMSRPVDVKYGRQGLGATLTLLTTGANAPMLEMQKEALRSRVNAVYGYNAISRIRITQTSPTGFAEGRADFSHRGAPGAGRKLEPSAQTVAQAQGIAKGTNDDGLRNALERLATNILNKSQNRTHN